MTAPSQCSALRNLNVVTRGILETFHIFSDSVYDQLGCIFLIGSDLGLGCDNCVVYFTQKSCLFKSIDYHILLRKKTNMTDQGQLSLANCLSGDESDKRYIRLLYCAAEWASK